MANQEHLEILRQGVDVWNQWREDNPDIKPDLKEADLSGAILSYAKLSNATLNGAELIGAYLNEAKLNNATLNGAKLIGANLIFANLIKANLSGASLSNANLSYANLSSATLIGINLSFANLTSATLIGANLSKANLSEADLSKTDLSRAKLSKLDLSGANLIGAKLSRANLSFADLRRANLKAVRLEIAQLINTRLDGANLTGSHLWETQRPGWSIKDVICEYAFWDKEAKEKTVYKAGEFEKLFSEKTKIKLFYKENISYFEVATLPALIQYLANFEPDCSLRFVSIKDDAGGTIVELSLEDAENLPNVQKQKIKHEIEAKGQKTIEFVREFTTEEERAYIMGRYDELSLRYRERLQLSDGKTVITVQGDMQMGSQYINKGQVGAMGDNAQAHNNTFNQIVNEENSEVKTQVQGDRNVTIGGNVSGSSIITGDDNKNEKD